MCKKPSSGSRSNRHKEHPWKPFRDDFQILYSLVSDPTCQLSTLNAQIVKIWPILVATASRILGSRQFRSVDCDPEAAAQDWLLKMLAGKCRRYKRARRPFYKFVYRILVNHCNSLGRRGKLRRTTPLDFDIVDRLKCPNQTIEDSERRRRVRHSLRRLAKLRRQAMILKYWLGQPSAVAGARVGLTAAAIDRLNHKTRELLQSQWTVQELLEDYHST